MFLCAVTCADNGGMVQINNWFIHADSHLRILDYIGYSFIIKFTRLPFSLNGCPAFKDYDKIHQRLYPHL